MVKLNLYVGRVYDGYGEQVAQRENLIITDIEAAGYLQELLEEKGAEYTRDWIKKVKGGDVIFPREPLK